MITRRTWLSRAALVAGGTALAQRLAGGSPLEAQHGGHAGHGEHPPPAAPPAEGTPVLRTAGGHPRGPAPPPAPEQRVITPNGRSLPWRMKDGAKEFHLIAEPVRVEFAPGMKVNAWGYNGSTPGPTIEAFEGERVRFYVTNKLPEHTTVHWHGILLPAGQDGVGGLNQPHIAPGETYVYEFNLRQHGTYMYHPHADEALQMAMGLMGFFVIHPGRPERRIDRDFALFPQMWAIDPGTFTPDPSVMLDFNVFTFNGRSFPGTAPLLVRRGERVKIRLANVSMTNHPIHFHGHRAFVTETDGGQIAPAGWWPETTIDVPPGTTRAFEFVADNPGDWALHCHKSHHAMNAMGHGLPNLLGVDLEGVEPRLQQLLPGYHTMGTTGMAAHAEHAPHLPGVANTLPMMMGEGPYGPLEMGGMFTLLKVRENLPADGADPGWYQYPEGSVARRVDRAPDDLPT